MCLLIVLSRIVPGLPLVFAGNRDERLDRPSEAMAVLREGGPRTLGGRDRVAGGTWLAVNEWGVVAGLTNRPSPAGADPTKRSRGELAIALTAHRSAEQAVTEAVGAWRPDDYNPAWLLVGDRHAAFALDLTGADGVSVRELTAGTHVLENRALDEPSAKADHVRRRLADVEHATPAVVAARLREVLADHEIPQGSAPPPTDGDAERPPQLGAACVHTEGYGTRWSGVITVPEDERARPTVSYTDGPACEATPVDASHLWTATRRSGESARPVRPF